MLFIKIKNCLALTFLICQNRVSVLSSCNCCTLYNLTCVFMKNCFKCSECTCLRCSCVDLLLDTLNCTCFKLKWDLNLALEKHEKLITKINCLCKTLHHNKSLQFDKASCVTAELADDNNDVFKDELNPLLFTDLSNDFWVFIISFSSQTAAVFLHS